MTEHITKSRLITTTPPVSATKTDQRRALGRTPLDLPLALFIISAFIGLWAAYDQSKSWPLLATLVGSLALYVILTWPRFSTTTLRRMAWILLLIQSALALYFISQYNHMDYPSKIGFVSHLGQLTGRFFPAWTKFNPHPNALATFIQGGLPLAAGLWLSAQGRRERLAAGLACALVGYGLLLTSSRGSWVAVATCAGLTPVVWGGRRLSPRWRMRGLIILVALAIVAGVGLMLIGPEHVPGLKSALLRGADRTQVYKNSLHLIRDYPLLGIGLGDTFGLVYSNYILLIPHTYLTYAHNLPLAIWLNQGLLGLLSFGWVLIAFYGLLIRQTRRGQSTSLSWGAALGVTAMLLHGLTDAPQYADSRWIMPIFYALLGLSVAGLQTTGLRMPNLSSRTILVALLILALTITMAFLLPAIFYVNVGALYHTRADLTPDLSDTARQQKLDQAIHYYERALEIDPRQPAAHWRLGLIALNANRFPQAIEHLEISRSALPGHRGVQKALGYAYLWKGQVDQAEELLRPLDEIPQELSTWSWWRGEQGQDQLADYAQVLESRLKGE